MKRHAAPQQANRTKTKSSSSTAAESARLDMLRWAGSLGAVTAEALAVRLDVSLLSARARLAAAARCGLLARSRPLTGAPALFTLTAAGARACGSTGRAYRVTPANATHLTACASVAARLERCYPGYRALGERELRSAERAGGRPLASARMAALRAGATGLHRPDLVLVPRLAGAEQPVAVEVELSVKAPQRLRAICRAWERCRTVAGVVYLVSPQVEAALLRAVQATNASRIAVVPLDALPSWQADAPRTIPSER